MAKASSSIDLKGTKLAGQVQKYITDITDAGIYISPANTTPSSGQERNSIKLDGIGLEIFKNNESIAFYGEIARIGKIYDNSGEEPVGQGNIITQSDGIKLRVGTTEVGSLKQLVDYDPWGGDFSYNNVLQLNAKEFFQLVSDSKIIMEAGTHYKTIPDYDSPDFDPETEQPTITKNEGISISFLLPHSSLNLSGKDNGSDSFSYSVDFIDVWEAIEEPTGNPKLNRWYERYYPYPDMQFYYYYQLSEDTTIVSGKTYYEQNTNSSSLRVQAFDSETDVDFGAVSLMVSNFGEEGMTRGLYDHMLPMDQWMIGRTEDNTRKLFGETLGDFVVEQGSVSGKGYYRIWASRTAECWIKTTQNVAFNSTYGSLYLGTYRWTFPITFSSSPTVTCSEFKWGTGAAWGLVGGAGTTYADLRGLDVVSRTSGSTVISAYAIGKCPAPY